MLPVSSDLLKKTNSHFHLQYVMFPGGVELPAHWKGMIPRRHTSTVKLDQSSTEYKKVLKNVKESAGIAAKGVLFEVSQ